MERLIAERLNPEAVEEKSLFSKLESSGLDKLEIKKFQPLINKIKFSNININSQQGDIHIAMVVSLLSQQASGKIFLQNIIKSINHKWEDIEEFLIKSTKDVDVEKIDFDIGANRRVDKIECTFANNDVYDFTISIDLIDHEDIKNSNSYVEKEVFESPLAKNNPVLQNYFGYLDRENSGHNYRTIAKEYLPGKNIAQYFNELDSNKFKNEEEISAVFSDLSCELAYSMGSLYKRMGGQLLDDLKFENIIYNYKNPDSDKSACRICDHSGYYSKNAEYKSVSQIVAHLSGLLAFYSLKIDKFEKNNNKNSEHGSSFEDLIINYFESFLSELDDPKLAKLLLEKIKEIKDVETDKRVFDLSDDLLEFIINYLESNLK